MNRDTSSAIGNKNAETSDMSGAVLVGVEDLEIKWTIGDRDTLISLKTLVQKMSEDRRVEILEARVAKLEGRMYYYAGAIAVIGFLVQVAPKFIHFP